MQKLYVNKVFLLLQILELKGSIYPLFGIYLLFILSYYFYVSQDCEVLHKIAFKTKLSIYLYVDGIDTIAKK